LTTRVIERARVAGCAALVVTIDTPVAGLRERDYRNGMKELMSGSLLEKMPFLPHVLARPAWVASFLRDGGLSKLPNVIIPGQGPMDLVDVSAGPRRGHVERSGLDTPPVAGPAGHQGRPHR
jgi:L-lactate dehydrogenase (cytochrome)